MPRFKQPRSLFQLTLDCIRNITFCAAEEDIKSKCQLTDTDTIESMGSTGASHQFQLLAQTCLPHVIACEVSFCMLDTIRMFIKHTLCLGDYLESFEHVRCQKAAEQLINSALYLGAHRLVMCDMPDYMKLVLCRNLPETKQLRILKFQDAGTKSMKTEIRELITSGVVALKELVKFTLHKHCNDAIIEVLAENCSKLEHLDVSFSKGVTDASVERITHMAKLNYLNIWGTFITKENSLQLLHNLRVLETYVADHKGGLEGIFPEQLQLRNYVTSFFTKAEKLSTLCPNLNKITIYASDCNLLPLSELKNLQHISLCNSVFVDIEKFLEASGSNLISLILREVLGVDFKTITLCTNLKSLELVRSTYYSNSVEATYDFTSPHFQSLEILRIMNYNAMNMEHFLPGYRNLKVLDLYDVSEPLNNILTKAFSSKCLLKLEIVNLNRCPTLTAAVIEEIISKCESLIEFVHHRTSIIGGYISEYVRLKSIFNKSNMDLLIERDY